jgi:hypothetical protein
MVGVKPCDDKDFLKDCAVAPRSASTPMPGVLGTPARRNNLRDLGRKVWRWDGRRASSVFHFSWDQAVCGCVGVWQGPSTPMRTADDGALGPSGTASGEPLATPSKAGYLGSLSQYLLGL